MKFTLPLLLLLLCFVRAERAQNSEPTLVDRFDQIPCSEFRYRLDRYMAEIAADRLSTGYVAISSDANQLSAARRRHMIEGQLAQRNFDQNRVKFVRRKGIATNVTELWKASLKSRLPFEHDREWSYKLPPQTKPFVLITGGFDDSECPPSRGAELVSQFLAANPSLRANIVIRCKGRNCDRGPRRQISKDLTGRFEIARSRVRFFYVPIKSEFYTYEFWLLNPGLLGKRSDELK